MFFSGSSLFFHMHAGEARGRESSCKTQLRTEQASAAADVIFIKSDTAWKDELGWKWVAK